jgi:predicted permease
MTRPPRIVRRVFHALARLYPRDFRARYGGELLETYRDAFRAAAARGGTAWRARFVAGAIGDAVATAGAEYFESSFPDRSAPMESTWRDLRYAARSLRRRPVFVGTVVATLALGIGANTAVFSLIDAVLLHPIAVDHPDRLVTVVEDGRAPSGGASTFGKYRDFVAQASAFSGLAAYAGTSVTIDDAGVPEEVSIALVTDNYFSVLGVRAAIGRTMAPGDPTEAGANAVMVISPALWRRHFGGDPSIVGKTVRIAGQSLTIVGVSDERFRGTELSKVPELWVPISMVPSLSLGLLSMPHILESRTGVPFFRIVGRLAPGVSRERAAAELNTIDARQSSATASAANPATASAGQRISLLPITQGAAMRDRESLIQFVRLLFVVVALTLLLACVNVANLLVVRAAERAREFGVRAALGASAGRLLRQLLLESLLLALAGGAAGLLVGAITVRLLSVFTLPGGIALSQLQLGLDPRVLAFTSVLSVLTAVAFGVIPAWRASRPDVVDVLKHSDGRAPTLAGRGALLTVQVAISLVLLIAAGLFLRSLQAGLSTNLGFDPRPLAAVSTPMQTEGKAALHVQRYMEIVDRAAALPGMIAVAASTHVPLIGMRGWPFAEGAATTSPSPNRKTMPLPMVSVTPAYFTVLGVPIVSGRGITAQDLAASPQVAVLNESAARAFWPSESPIGKQINFMDAETYTIVGVVRDIKYATLQDEDVPFAYAPMVQKEPIGTVSFIARSGNPKSALAALQRTMKSTAPELVIRNPRLVIDQIDQVLMPQRFGATLLSVFSLVALAVSAVGIYGTVAYTVARRTTEIGIRMALGARRTDVLELVLFRTAASVAAGIAIGLFAAGLATKLVVHFLFGITALDALAFGGAIGVMVVVAIGVALAPARRATRIDPVDAMRISS